MTHEALLQEASRLSLKDRLDFLEDLWDGMADEMDKAPLLPWQEKLLDARVEAMERDPNAGSSYEQVVERIRQRKPDCS